MPAIVVVPRDAKTVTPEEQRGGPARSATRAAALCLGATLSALVVLSVGRAGDALVWGPPLGVTVASQDP